MNVIEYHRKKAVKDLFAVSSFFNNFPTWRNEILSLCNVNNASDVLNIGDSLADIFNTTNTTGRTQGGLSGGGIAWESLVCYYINLCLIGTRGVCVRSKKELVPSPISDSMIVNYGNHPSGTESDLLVIVYPDQNDFNNDMNGYGFTDINGNVINYTRTYRGNTIIDFKKLLNQLTHKHFNHIELGNIQCKTNWNDNAQIPMLWDMIYSTVQLPTNVSIGINGYNINGLKKFSYSFVTTPSSGLGQYNISSLSVKRVMHLSGGNYWGHPTLNGVAKSIKEIINSNFSNAIRNSYLLDLYNELINLSTTYSYFQL